MAWDDDDSLVQIRRKFADWQLKDKVYFRFSMKVVALFIVTFWWVLFYLIKYY